MKKRNSPENFRNQKITLCVSCRYKDSHCSPGLAFITKLRRAIDVAALAATEEIEISGTAQLSGCGRSCTAAYRATVDAVFFFGGTEAGECISSLIEYADQCSNMTEPFGATSPDTELHSETNLSRQPAAIIVSKSDDSPIH